MIIAFVHSAVDMNIIILSGRFMRLPQPFFVSPATVVPPVSIVPPPVELLVYPPTTAGWLAFI